MDIDLEKIKAYIKSKENDKTYANGFLERKAKREKQFEKNYQSMRITDEWLNRRYTI